MSETCGLIAVGLLVLAPPGCVSPPFYGVDDSVNARAIDRANALQEMRQNTGFEQLAVSLNRDLQRYASDRYAYPRIQNELADIYTFQHTDLERAISIDSELIKSQISDDSQKSQFNPAIRVANNRILGAEEYVKEYVSVSGETIKERARERLTRNNVLLLGRSPASRRSPSIAELEQNRAAVKRDIDRSISTGRVRNMLLSRLIRVEYEIGKRTKKYKYSSEDLFTDGQLTAETVDQSEIDFISLADYFYLAFRQTRNPEFARLALETIYRPYLNLRNNSNRWNYNKLINIYISTLIVALYESGQFEGMLYYATLNKSRMLLEERLAIGLERGGKDNIANISADDGIVRDARGLPDRKWFSGILSSLGTFVDFYVDGDYRPQEVRVALHGAERPVMPLNARDFGVEDQRGGVEAFSDNAVYVTLIREGQIASVKRLSGHQLATFKRQLAENYNAFAGKLPIPGTVTFLQSFAAANSLPKELTISPDKWLMRHPLGYFLGGTGTRAVNIFTYHETGKLDSLTVAGFFDPTLDLPGSELEAKAIQAQIPDARVFSGRAARLDALAGVGTANVVHLSMHGAFNPDNPRGSKLYFNGASRGLASGDPNALYAADIGRYRALQNRDLIFAAACQTGLTASDAVNQSEVIGLLRYLTAYRNRNVILSLWKVDDEATKDFVAAFYKSLSQSRDVLRAFYAAQSAVRTKYSHPYYWAPFYIARSR